MKIRTMFSLAAMAGCLTASAALAETHVNVSIGVGNAPPPPVVVVRQEPRTLLVPGSAVYVVNDDRWGYDCFHYGVYWYAYNDGFWYRSRAWRGPFASVRTEIVPRAIMSVPETRWKHHPHGMPPGQARRQAVVVERQPAVVVRPVSPRVREESVRGDHDRGRHGDNHDKHDRDDDHDHGHHR